MRGRDEYALAAVVYEMLAGETPFMASTPQAMIAKMMASAAPFVRIVRRDVPRGVDTAIRKALAATPAARYPSAGAFVTALETGLAQGGTEPRVPLRWLAAAVLAIVLLAAGGYVWYTRSTAAPGPVMLAVLPVRQRRRFRQRVLRRRHHRTRSAASSRPAGPPGDRQRQLQRIPAQREIAAGNRPRVGRALLAGRTGAVGSPPGARRGATRPRRPGAGAGRWRSSSDQPLATVDRRTARRCLQGPDRHRDGGRRATRGSRWARASAPPWPSGPRRTWMPTTRSSAAPRTTRQAMGSALSAQRSPPIRKRCTSTRASRRHGPHLATRTSTSYGNGGASAAEGDSGLRRCAACTGDRSGSRGSTCRHELLLLRGRARLRQGPGRSPAWPMQEQIRTYSTSLAMPRNTLGNGIPQSRTSRPPYNSIREGPAHWQISASLSSTCAATPARDGAGPRTRLTPADLTKIEWRVMASLGEGDLAGAQRVLHAVPATVDQALARQFHRRGARRGVGARRCPAAAPTDATPVGLR